MWDAKDQHGERQKTEPNPPYFGPARLNGGRFKMMIHQTRESLASITSMACTEPITDSRYYTYIQRHVPFERTKYRNNRIALGMQMWVGWHTFLLRLDNTGMYRFKLEDLSGENGDDRQGDVVRRIFTSIGRKAPTPTVVAAASKKHAKKTSGKQTNSRSHRSTLSWDELFRADEVLAMQAWRLTLTFGYTYPDFDPTNVKPGPIPSCKHA